MNVVHFTGLSERCKHNCMKNVKMKDQYSYHHGDLAAVLIAASPMLIARHGVEGFSIRQAAALVGVAPSAAYRHFDNKDALIAAVAGRGFAGGRRWKPPFRLSENGIVAM